MPGAPTWVWGGQQKLHEVRGQGVGGVLRRKARLGIPWEEAAVLPAQGGEPGGREAAGLATWQPHSLPYKVLSPLPPAAWVGQRTRWGCGWRGWSQLSQPRPTHPPNGTREALSGGRRVRCSPLVCRRKSTNLECLRTQAWPGSQDTRVPILAPQKAVHGQFRVHVPFTCTASSHPQLQPLWLSCPSHSQPPVGQGQGSETTLPVFPWGQSGLASQEGAALRAPGLLSPSRESRLPLPRRPAGLGVSPSSEAWRHLGPRPSGCPGPQSCSFT